MTGLNLACFYLMMVRSHCIYFQFHEIDYIYTFCQLKMICIITDLYYFALSTAQKTCSEWIYENINIDSVGLSEHMCENWGAVVQNTHFDKRASFEDPCRDYAGFRKQQNILCGILFLLIMSIFMSTIWEGHHAVNQVGCR